MVRSIMNKEFQTLLMSLLCGLTFLAAASVAQDGQERVVLESLGVPVYPPSALQARISGDVELEIVVRRDGSVESSRVVNGDPLLSKAALDSSQRSKFDCQTCTSASDGIHLIYSFQLGPTKYCSPANGVATKKEKQNTYPRISRDGNHVTIIGQPLGTCDPAVELSRFRAAKCLYLWRCGKNERILAPVN
jgi:TonB family protein